MNSQNLWDLRWLEKKSTELASHAQPLCIWPLSLLQPHQLLFPTQQYQRTQSSFNFILLRSFYLKSPSLPHPSFKPHFERYLLFSHPNTRQHGTLPPHCHSTINLMIFPLYGIVGLYAYCPFWTVCPLRPGALSHCILMSWPRTGYLVKKCFWLTAWIGGWMNEFRNWLGFIGWVGSGLIERKEEGIIGTG